MNDNMSIQVNGVITAVPTRNKAGRLLEGVSSYFLEYNDNRSFIKMMESKIEYDALKSLIDKPAIFEIQEKNGLWDTDDPNVQSRIGEYIVIINVVKNSQ